MMAPASAGVSRLRLGALIAAAALPALGCGGVRAGAGAPRTRPAAAMTGAPGTAGLARPGGPDLPADPPNEPRPGRPAPASLDGHAKGAMARVSAAVAALRGLPFTVEVTSSPQSRDEFRQVVRDDLAREIGPQKNAALSKALSHTGFLPGPIDFAATLEEAETTQVAAYYDPRTGRFHTVVAAADGDDRDAVVAHELTHALQHQHFDLIGYDGGPDNAQHLSDDQRAARRYVVEGEATFVMLAYQSGSGSGAERHLGPLQVAAVRMSLTMMSAVDYVDVLALVRTGEAAEKLGAESRQSMDALARLPPLVAVSIVDPYIRGAFLVSEAWARGGWARVGGLYRQPPESTEQVLHPVEKLLDRRDPPIAIRLPPPASIGGPAARIAATEPLLQETAGELDWRCYFKTWSDPDPERAASGWGGDLVTVWERAGKPVAATATRWDSLADAVEFEQAYRRSLGRRFGHKAGAPPLPPAPSSSNRWSVRRPDGTAIVVQRRGLDVDIVDGAHADEIDPLLAMLGAAERSVAASPAPRSLPLTVAPAP
jgi:hypothetical protein